MKQFDELDQLINCLNTEANAETRFPVRFILVSGQDAWSRLVQRLRIEVDHHIWLSSWCDDVDCLPYLGRLEPALLKETSRRVLILPLSECIRFSPSAAESLVNLITMEKVGYQRFYIPLFELDDVFHLQMASVSRYGDDQCSDVWKLKGYSSARVYVAPAAIRQGIKTVNGFKDYLALWEQGGDKEVQFVTSLAPHLTSQVGNYEVKVYGNTYDIVKSIVKNDYAGASILQSWGTDAQWQWLSEQLASTQGFKYAVSRTYNVRSYSPDLLHKWNKLDDKHRWLLWLWGKLELDNSTYLGLVLNKSVSFDTFTDDVINGVFNIEKIRFLEERKFLLEALEVIELPESFWASYDCLKDPTKKLKVLSGITRRERQEVILIVRNLIEKDIDKSEWWSYLEIAYPELTMYLSRPIFDHEFIDEYFALYRVSRILDRPLPRLLEMAKQAASDRLFWTFPTRESELEAQASVAKVWVDGMGLEWVALITELIQSAGLSIGTKTRVTRVNLPSITSQNKGWTQPYEVDTRLDEIAHKSTYSFPEAFVEQIEVVKEIAEKAIQLMSQNKKVVITSDHGMTRFKSNNRLSTPEGATTLKCGRYIELREDYDEHTFYNDPSCIAEGNRLISTVHEKFEGGAGFAGEIHGGATLEECLVPVISLHQVSKSLLSETCKLVFLSPKVKLDHHNHGQLVVKMDRPLEKLVLIVGGRAFQGVHGEANDWFFTLEGLPPGDHNARLKLEDDSYIEITITIIKGLIQDDLGL